MTIEVTIANRQRKVAVDKEFWRQMTSRVCAAVCRNLEKSPCLHIKSRLIKQIDERGQLSLVLVSDKQIKELNSQWRQKDKATDVLSFPLGLEAPFDKETPFELGEIFISLETAARQAQDYNHSVEREFGFLFAHGVLHILGFDHENKEDEKEMFGRQRKILEASGYKR